MQRIWYNIICLFLMDWKMTKAPHYVYSNLLEIVGRDYNNPIVAQSIANGYVPFEVVESERGTYGFQHPDNLTFVVEDIFAMILTQAKQIASKTTSMSIKDAVIMVCFDT